MRSDPAPPPRSRHGESSVRRGRGCGIKILAKNYFKVLKGSGRERLLCAGAQPRFRCLPGRPARQGLVPGSLRAGDGHSPGLAAVSQGGRASPGGSSKGEKGTLVRDSWGLHLRHARAGTGGASTQSTLHPSRRSRSLLYYYYCSAP